MSKPIVRRLTDLTPNEKIARNIYRTELGRVQTLSTLTECKKPVWMMLLCLLGIVLMMQGCKSEQQERKEREDLARRTLSTTTFNYTKYELYSINFMNENKKFEIANAASGGGVFFNHANFETLIDGTKVSFESGACCFIWSGSDKPVKLRLVWSVVYDYSKFEGKESDKYDDRKSKQARPGSTWCEGVVDIVPPYPSPNNLGDLFLHFFEDGTVSAYLGERGNFGISGIRPLDEVKQHSTPLPLGKYCLHEISNPWYGIPRKPHME